MPQRPKACCILAGFSLRGRAHVKCCISNLLQFLSPSVSGLIARWEMVIDSIAAIAGRGNDMPYLVICACGDGQAYVCVSFTWIPRFPQSVATRLFVHQLVHANNRVNIIIKTALLGFVAHWSVDSPHKGPMWKTFPWHDVFMHNNDMPYAICRRL